MSQCILSVGAFHWFGYSHAKDTELCSTPHLKLARPSELQIGLDYTSGSYFHGAGELQVAPELPVSDPWFIRYVA